MPLDGGLLSARLLWDAVEQPEEFPYALPAIRNIDALDLCAPVTFFIGENGSGKSTLLEAIAVVAGVNPEGGSRNLRFGTRVTESSLHECLRLSWSSKPRWAFFLRAETFFGMATAYEDSDPEGIHETRLHDLSHGQQFLDAANRKLQPGGLHLMDEPEAALSVTGQPSMLHRIHDVQGQGGQFIIATHSPILLAYPGAVIYEFSSAGVVRTTYDDAPPVALTRSFLDAPERFLHHLLDEPASHASSGLPGRDS